MTSRDHWPRHARQWALVGPPLRPSADDVAIVERAVAGLGGARALLLGVTPELATMRWPAGTTLVALDRSQAMIDAIFPRAGVPGGATARRGEWLAMPLAEGAIDVAVGDGCPSNLAFPGAYRAFAAECRRVLAPGGRLVLRVFAAPEDAPSIEAVGAAVARGEVASFHALKWRLAMAIQPADRNVAVADILRAFEAIAPDRDALAARTGWPRAEIDTIDAYRGSDVRYSFPTAREIGDAIGAALGLVARHGGEAPDTYPTLIWTRR